MITPQSSVEDTLIGNSLCMRQLMAYVKRAAATDSSVLITGETGTGKERIARAIHEQSHRRDCPMIPINCAALPEGLLESELFGYERGAFTGATTAYPGKLKLADGGTVFLDEIGDTSAAAQAKLLRALESREAYRLGGRHSVPFDVRIIAATNSDPEELVAAARFRKDLFFRINVARVHLPPLRERKEDIVPLFNHYVAQMNRHYGLRVRGCSSEALSCLLHYEWPGNVREIKNLVESIFIDPPAAEIGIGNLPERLRNCIDQAQEADGADRERLLEALILMHWNVSQAAKTLHWSRMTVYRKMAKYRIARAPQKDVRQQTGTGSRNRQQRSD
jgi:transcriptional regulator with PAS, ATPase and Fis domain